MKSYSFPQGDMPAIGLGTWKMEDGVAEGAVTKAIELGYRYFDCAPIYLNEAEIGESFGAAFNGGGHDRSEFWITSKLWCNRHRPDLVQGALKQTLSDLKLDYLDLFMIHWPIVFRHDIHRPESGADFISLEDQPLVDTWAAMEDCATAGLCRNLGVCNFNVANLQAILDNCRIKPSANQVECHPFLNQRVLFDFCRANDIHLIAYSPLGSGDRPERMRDEADPNLFEDELLKDLASKNKISVGELLLAWAVCRGTIAIPKSANPTRLSQNLAAGEIELSAEDMAAIENLETQYRFVHGKFWEQPGGPYTAEAIWGAEGKLS